MESQVIQFSCFDEKNGVGFEEKIFYMFNDLPDALLLRFTL